MKLYYDKRAKDPIYYAQVGFRNAQGKPTTRNVKSFGHHSELLKTHDDPLAYVKAEIARMNEEEKVGHSTFDIRLDFNQKLSPSDAIVSASETANIGYLYLLAVYQKLKLGTFFDKVTADRKMTFDCNDINMMLTAARIMDPGSKLYTVSHLDQFFHSPVFSHQQVLRFMDVLYDCRDEYLKWLYKYSSKAVNRDTSVMFYDCTNFYFESENIDEEIIDPVTGEVIKDLRQFGVSKEHRPNPIVEMGLFIDNSGIPVSMYIHPGNTSEQITAVPLEREIVRMTEGKKFIYCADAGLGSSNIRLFNSMGGRSFVVTQSIKKLSDVLKTAVFNDTDYRLLSDDREVTLRYMHDFDRTDEDNLALYNDKAYKVLYADNAVDLGLMEEKHLKDGSVKMVKSKANLKQRIIVTFSRKQMEYQRAVRNRQIERAKRLLKTNDPENIKKGPNDVRRFLKRTAKGKSGENASVEYVLDAEKIAEEEKYDGFYALATNLEDEDVRGILGIVRNRADIEQCFRIMKTNYDGRPVYHQTNKRIEAHFFICYTALLIHRLLDKMLDSQGTHVTPDNLIETLKNLNVLNIDDLFYRAAYTDSTTLEALEKLFKLKFNYHNFKPGALRKIAKNLQKKT